ncbi:MAG: ATP phosphoribosyltransferase regulatory subunit, partial [Deltaproteobacteria bacterium HGW-Deltaproteobacteria-23]
MRPESFLNKENSIPKGVTDFLPEQAEKIGFIERTINRTFELWGFRKIIPPMLEFEDLLAVGMDESLRAKSFRFEDRQSHRLLAVPPDITPQIARIESMRMKSYPFPHRIYYNGRVLRHVESQSGRSREIYQAGVELIGLDSPEADAEMIAMSVEAMRKIGFEDFKVDLGQVDFYRGIMASADLELDTAAEIQSAIARKDLSSVTSILETINISDSSKSEIFALSRLFGGIELLDKAYITVRNDRSRRALDNLAKVINILSMYGVSKELTVDLGEIRGLAYHTGLTFEGFVPGLGEPICGGGRYDSLMGKYGESRPATGFAFNMLNLLQVFDNTSSRDIAQAHSFLIFSTKEDKKSALSLASALRRQGFPVARDIIRRDFAQSIEYARFNGIEYTLVIGD